MNSDLWWDPSPNCSHARLANFVVECRNDGDLMAVYRRAQERLKEENPSFDAFEGYDSGRRERVLEQIECLYNAIAACKIAPTKRATDFPDLEPQTVRGPTSVFQAHQANCIDVSVVLSALLLRAGLNPLILAVGSPNSTKPDHALLGCWLSDGALSDVQSDWDSLKPRLKKFVFVESLGMLDGKCRMGFREAMVEAGWSLPQADREVAAPECVVVDDHPRLVRRSDKKVFYVIDIRAALVRRRPCIISIMGAKGGVGKTTLAARMAELVAETGNSVLLIDVDVESAGTTILHRRRALKGVSRGVKTVYDHLRDLQDGRSAPRDRPGQDAIEDVTPKHLDESRFGRLYLIPARPLSTVSDRWEAVANIPAATRNETLLTELDQMIRRADSLPPEPGVACVIIDCGAEFNPLVSAAFHLGDYGFVIANPDPICLDNINAFDHSHRARFPGFDLGKIQIIVNRVQSESQEGMWKGLQRFAGFIPDDPELQRDWYDGRLSFQYGYGDISRKLVAVMNSVFRHEHRGLIPDEISVWIAPWWKLIKEHHLPRRILDPKFDPQFKPGRDFRRTTKLARLGLIVSALVFLSSAFLLARSSATEPASTTVAVMRFVNEDQARLAQADLATGRDFFDVGSKYGGVPSVGPVDTLHQVGGSPSLQDCVVSTPGGSVCAKRILINGAHYLVKVLQKPQGSDNTTSGTASNALQRLAGLILLLTSVLGLARAIKLALMQQRKTRVLRDLDAVKDPAVLAQQLQLEPKTAGAGGAVEDVGKFGGRVGPKILESLAPPERRLIQFLIQKKQIMEWLHHLLDEERLKQKIASA